LHLEFRDLPPFFFLACTKLHVEKRHSIEIFRYEKKESSQKTYGKRPSTEWGLENVSFLVITEE